MKAKEKLSRVGISYFFFNGISFSLIGILEIFDFLEDEVFSEDADFLSN